MSMIKVLTSLLLKKKLQNLKQKETELTLTFCLCIKIPSKEKTKTRIPIDLLLQIMMLKSQVFSKKKMPRKI